MSSHSVAATSWPNSLWRSTAPEQSEHPRLDEHITCDVLVIGAGFTGLNSALRLSEAGSSVVVLDAGDVGWGASGRNGGQVNPMLPFNSPDMLNNMLGSTYFERLTETSLNSADELFDLIRSYQINCQARQNGWLRVNHNDRSRRKSETNIRDWNKFGAGMTLVEGELLSKLSGTRAYRSGVITPRGGAVQPLMLAQGLASAAKRNGAIIHGKSPVLSLEQQSGKWEARTESGSVSAEWVAVATNGYTDDLLPKLSGSIIPITPIQIATDPLPDDVIGSILPEGHTISDSRRIIMYARREPDNRMVYGGMGKPGPNGEIAGFDWLQRDAERVYPQLKGVNWTHRWGGHIAFTDDHLPHLHEPRKGLLVGLGYNGRGVAMSNVMGRVMAERILGADAESLAFPVTPIKPIPMRGIKVMGLNSAIGVMRLMDYLETR
jgi:glycine/D-amino acid oxidase-like deaminating enzyme